MKNFTSNPNKIQPESKPLETKKSTTRISFWWLVFVFTLLINTNAFSQSGSYRVQWISMNLGSPSWNAGEVRTVSVTLKNIGTQTWIDAVGSGDVNIGVKWNAEPDYMIRVDAGNLAPGATQTYNLTVTAPSIGGNNNLQFNVVRELICWFPSCDAANSPYTSSSLFIIGPTQPYQNQWISMNVGSTTWCPGEVRNVSVTVKNIGTQTWIDGSGAGDINVGVKWNAEPDYLIRVNAGNLAPGATQTYNFTVTAPASIGTNNLRFDVVNELISWFRNYGGTGNIEYISPTLNINPASVLTSATAATVCSGSAFTYTPTASVGGTTFTWTRAAVAGISNAAVTVPQATNPNETLINTTSNPINVIYAYQLTSGCTNSQTVTVTVNPASGIATPTFTFGAISARCTGAGTITYTASSVGSTGITYSLDATSLGAGNTINSSTGAVSYTAGWNGTSTITATAVGCGGPKIGTHTATTSGAPPPVVITPNYCTGGGFVTLSATNTFASYLWSNGQTTQTISTVQAGPYSVTATLSAGCSSSTSINVATELVVNGNFSAGNTGFTSQYIFDNSANGLANGGSLGGYGEGDYSVVNNAKFSHSAFNGKDHTTGTGNMMVVNGTTAYPNVWAQTFAVQPNTTYYFSAWGLSVYNSNPAVLQFVINGNQVGSIASLQQGYSNPAGPYNWVRFYGSWDSGPSTSVSIAIKNLNAVFNGNDFALDDISFGTLSPISLSSSPSPNSGGSICTGSALFLTPQAQGGASPFSYSWSGPNSFTSNVENPTVTANASALNSGTYNLTLTDGLGCTATASTTVTVNSLPSDITPTAVLSSICAGTSTSIQILAGQNNVSYQLRNNVNNNSIGDPFAGDGSTTIILPTGTLNSTTTFNILATNTSGCSRQLSITPSVTVSTTPVLSITNQAACSGTVNLTLAAVTVGSTGGGTLSYWNNIAASSAIANPSSVSSGTYYIKSTVASCFDIEPVTVIINATPVATFSYTGTPYCSKGTNPLPTFSGGGVAGTFSSLTAGIVFTSTSTGQINVAASTPGTYTIRNTITPAGACPVVSATSSFTITAAPLTGFSYAGLDICQAINATNLSPIFSPGAAAGTFASTFGLSFVSTATGVINVAASTPGNYAVWNTRAATGGCPAFSDTIFVDVNPYTLDGSIFSNSSLNSICTGQTVNLFANGTSYSSVLLREKFNGTINNWVKTNPSTGGTSTNAAWNLRANGYNYATTGTTFNSNDNSQFYLSNSKSQGIGGTTSTILKSPVMSTVGYSSLTLNFFHYYRFGATTGESAKVEVATNNLGPWTSVATYTSNQGASNSFVNTVINLNAYIGQPIFYVRFRYNASNGFFWAIDNVSLTGNTTNYTYSWVGAPSAFTSTEQNPINVAPTVSSFYVVTAKNTFGCSAPASPLPVIVNLLPTPNAGSPSSICSGLSTTIGAANTVGRTYSWSPSTGLSSATISNPTASSTSNTTYTLTETITATNCSASNSVIVTVTNPGQWLGTYSANWNDVQNWCSSVPTSTTDVVIPSGTTYSPQINTTAFAKNLTIQSGASLSFNPGGELRLNGVLSNSGIYTQNTGTLQLSGSSSQTLPAITVYDLTLNNSAGVTLNGNLIVNGTLTLTSGKITTGSNEVQVTNNAAGAITSYSTNSYVTGKLRRSVATTGTYDFPVGSSANYQLATVKLNSANAANTILASFTSGTPTPPIPTSCFINLTQIFGILNSGYWTITPGTTYTAVNYDITLKESGYSNFIGNPTQLGVLKRSLSTDPWAGTNLANVNGNHNNATQSIVAGVATAKRSGITSFSDFGIGFGGATLPIKLSSFTAEKTTDNLNALLKWTTASEENNDHFDIEVANETKSDGNLNFKKIGEVKGSGTSFVSTNYDYTDTESGKSGIRYYRLKQVDFNGEFTYTDIKPLEFNTVGVSLSSLYPNPVNSILNFIIQSQEDVEMQVSINNVAGQEIFREYLQLGTGTNNFNFDVRDLLNGVYQFNVKGKLQNNQNIDLHQSFIKN
jgi:hypothetical protein